MSGFKPEKAPKTGWMDDRPMPRHWFFLCLTGAFLFALVVMGACGGKAMAQEDERLEEAVPVP